LAWRVFGRERVDAPIRQIHSVLIGWGYRVDDQQLSTVVCQMMLLSCSPVLDDLIDEVMLRLRRDAATGPRLAGGLYGIHRAVAALGHVAAPPAPKVGSGLVAIEGTASRWAEWAERWHATSTLTPTVRGIYRTGLSKIGRWLAAEHPDITSPAQWTRQTCASWVAAVDRMSVGDYVQQQTSLRARVGKPLTAKTKSAYLRVARTFFRECPEWEWIPRRFDPSAALGTPRTIKALLGPDPRVIADDHLGQTVVGRPQPQARRPALASRPVLPGRVDPRDHADLAVQRSAQRRDRPAPPRLHPLATRRHADSR
jgi:hypothetical protein